MAQISVRLPVQGMTFPMLSEQCGLTVVDGRGDLTYVPGVSTDGDVPENRGVPNITYAENVMPSAHGWQSVGYEQLVGNINEPVQFYDIKLVHGALIPGGASRPSASGLRTYIGAAYHPALNMTYLYYIADDGQWDNVVLQGAGAVVVSGKPLLTAAHVNGYSYVCIEGVSQGVINVDTGTLIPRPLNGIDMPSVKGLLSANGFLIAFTINFIAWSSTVDVEDFVPSDITGAGGGNVQEAAGDIITCKSTSVGFIIFTDSNTVAAIYTGNTAFPFEFKEITASGGVARFDFISDETVAGAYYAITTNGIQKISPTGAQTVLTSIADFLSGREIEYFEHGNRSLTKVTLLGDMGRRIQTVANRYIIISYAVNEGPEHEFALVVDAMQNRIGRLRTGSARFFELQRTETFTDLDPRATLGILGAFGQIRRVRFDIDCEISKGVMIFGRVQYMHQRLTQLQEVKVERTCSGSNFAIETMYSTDGATFGGALSNGYLRPQDVGKTSRRYLFSHVGVNHALVLSGTFDINSIVLSLNTHGMTSGMV